MARNDDPEYVRSLERALEAAELEIKGLEGELREQDKVLQQLHDQLSPTHMGEPLIARPKVGAGGTALEVHGTVFFKDGNQYRSQLRFPIADGAYELVRIENPDMTHPLFHAADDTATLHQQIRSAQIAAGEDAVTANLRSMGLLPNAEVSGCLRAPMPEDAPMTAAGSPFDRPVGPVAGA